MFADSHCHLDLLNEQYTEAEVDAIVAEARVQDVHYILNVCVSILEFPLVLQTAERHNHVFASVGLHPNNQDEEVNLETLLHLAKHEKVVAIGETGLDYFRSTGDLSWQKTRFKHHIEAAKLLQKPLIVHTRNASEDTMQFLEAARDTKLCGVMHCFTENWDIAKRALDLGFYISFSGIVTFKNASALQDVAKKIPLDRLLIETDAPYLAPEPHRGKTNSPIFLRHTAQFLAALRQENIDIFARETTRNFFTLFNLAETFHV